MKFSIVFICCGLLVLGEVNGAKLDLPKELIDLLENLSKTCEAETGVDESVVASMRKAKLVDDPKAKCYLKCMMMQLQAMQDDGSLDIDLIEGSMPEALKAHGGMETVQKCKHIKLPDLCETAYQLMACFQKENPTLAAMFE